jgi:hypothetical protein
MINIAAILLRKIILYENKCTPEEVAEEASRYYDDGRKVSASTVRAHMDTRRHPDIAIIKAAYTKSGRDPRLGELLTPLGDKLGADEDQMDPQKSAIEEATDIFPVAGQVIAMIREFRKDGYTEEEQNRLLAIYGQLEREVQEFKIALIREMEAEKA